MRPEDNDIEISEKPLKKLVYWVCPAKAHGGVHIRAKTRKEANSLRHKSYQWEAQKVTVPYRDLVDLVNNVTNVGLNQYEK